MTLPSNTWSSSILPDVSSDDTCVTGVLSAKLLAEATSFESCCAGVNDWETDSEVFSSL